MRVEREFGFAVFTIVEDWCLRDAIALAQALTQQQIGGSTRLATQLIAKLQTLFAALGRQQRQRSLYVEMGNIIIDIDLHFSLITYHSSLITHHSSASPAS